MPIYVPEAFFREFVRVRIDSAAHPPVVLVGFFNPGKGEHLRYGKFGEQRQQRASESLEYQS
jgi:hypothetical protein